MRKLFCILFLITNFSAAQGQVFQRNPMLKLIVNSDTAEHAFTGSFNCPQFSRINLDNDGIEDLFVFDRTTDKVTTFIIKPTSSGIKYVHAPSYESFFPALKGWALLRDYNCDGKKDIFTNTPQGIMVYKNVTTGLYPQWQLVADPIYTRGFGGPVNLQVSITDIPAILDMDNDSDLDILTFDFGSGTYVEFHKNLSIENFGTCDTLKYQRTTACWGEFSEADSCERYNFGITCKTNDVSIDTSAREAMHTGSALALHDLSGDGVKDLVLSDVSCTRINSLINTASNVNAVFTGFNADFPTNFPVNYSLFPAPYLEDLNLDGKLDLIAAPNVFNNTAKDVDFAESAWLYLDTSATNVPEYKFIQKDFLQVTGIDLGERSHPLFLDVDADNDEDLLLTSWGRMYQIGKVISIVHHYENKGGGIFELANRNFNDFEALKVYGLKLAKGDLNGDGATDLIYTYTPVGSNTTKTAVVYNLRAAGTPPEYKLNLAVDLTITNTNGDAPFLYDIDQDNDNDLLVGASGGALKYYENTGNISSPVFTLITDTLGGIRNSSRSFCVPFVTNITGGNRPDLITGDNSGKITVYPDFTTNLLGSYTNGQELTVYNSLNGGISQPAYGRNISPYIIHLDSDTLLDILCGTGGGGMFCFKNVSDGNYGVKHNVPTNNLIKIFPVPAHDEVFITGINKAYIMIFTPEGKIVAEYTATEKIKINTEKWPAGIYFCAIKEDKTTSYKKISIYR